MYSLKIHMLRALWFNVDQLLMLLTMYSTSRIPQVFNEPRMYQVQNLYPISWLDADDTLMLDNQLMVPISQNTTMKFTTSGTELLEYSFGGRKVSLDAPPNYWMDDQVQYLPSDQSNATLPSNEMGTTAFAYISLHPDAFHMTSDEDKPVAIETHFKVWSWIENPSGPVIRMLDDLNMTFYIWPIVCSLSVHNVTAWVHVQGNTQLKQTNARMALANLTTPSIKSIVPSDPMVISWSYLMDLLFLVDLPGLSLPKPLIVMFNQTWSLTSLEDQLSQFTAFYYAVLVQYWQSAALNGDLTASQWWSEARGSVVANQLTLFGRLDFSVSQLVLGCVCIVALMITSTLSILGVRVQQGVLMDGSVMNMISLLRGSSLPGIIAGDGDEDLGKNGRRHRAERTIVMYKDSTLDIPEWLEGEVFSPNSGDNETTGLQSSLRGIALSEEPEDERLLINSGDDGSTDLIQMITLPQRQEDEHLPLNSEDPKTTGSQILLRRVTLRERLEGDDLINSGDAEKYTPDGGNLPGRVCYNQIT
ncbi:hypothetical protein BS47DRAFT_1127730 [Hydnum rufescens UP504]|uniref:Uncharacterized protein n=1 Tax=Hydnum rufescens UP504 TaxID=1448309 RepID=A0A9P6DVR7_9AGAM|nr:hypothetical protein BS47DRAFT_1127730 [Hydnum rufescens UP504]